MSAFSRFGKNRKELHLTKPHAESLQHAPSGLTGELGLTRDRFLDFLRHERRYARHTLEAYRRDLDGFGQFCILHRGDALSQTDFFQLTITDFRAWLAHQLRRGIKPKSVARALSALKSFNRFCHHIGLGTNQTLPTIRSPKTPRHLPHPLQQTDSFRLLEAAANHSTPWIGARDVALCTLLWGAGLRISEALALSKQDLLHNNTLRVVGKGQKERLVPILPIVNSAIAEYLRLCPFDLAHNAPLFRGQRGGTLGARIVQGLFQRLRRTLGLAESVTPHAMRHSFASDLLRHGSDLRTIQELLGHSSLSSTQIYADIDRHGLAQIYQDEPPSSE